MIGVYGIYRRSDNVCVYVGQSKNIEKRTREHLRYSVHHNFNEIDYYAKEIEIFDNYDKEELLKREGYWIRTLDPEYNYYGSSKTKTYICPHKKKDDNLQENELYMISCGEEQLYFTSLYRIGKFLNKQRAQVEYSMLKNKNVDGWSIDIVDGSKVMWEDIDIGSK